MYKCFGGKPTPNFQKQPTYFVVICLYHLTYFICIIFYLFCNSSKHPKDAALQTTTLAGTYEMLILNHKCHLEHIKCLFQSINGIRNIEKAYFKA